MYFVIAYKQYIIVVVCSVTLLRILESIGYMSISSDDLKYILRLLKVEEDETVVRHCIVSINCVCSSLPDRLITYLVYNGRFV